MKYEPQTVIKHFEINLTEVLKSTFKDWLNFHNAKLNQLQIILDPLKVHLVQNEEWTEIPLELWVELGMVLQEISSWIDQNHYIDEELTAEKLCSPLHREFEKLVQELPEEIKILPGDTFWFGQKGDGIYVRARKRLIRIGRWFRARQIGFINLFKKIRKKELLQKPQYERQIPLRQFTSYFIETPLVEFVVDEWQRFMQSVSGQLFVMQAKNEDLNERVLLLDKFDEILKSREEVNIFDELFQLAEVLKHLDETLQALYGYDKQFVNHLATTWDKIKSEFETNWQIIDTFRLKNKQISNEKLLKARTRFEEKFKHDLSLWDKHWYGLREDWKKDLQLSSLQLHAARYLVRTSRSLRDRVHKNIEPKYKHLLDVLNDTAAKFSAVKNHESLLTMINEAKSSLLVELPRQMLPQIMDTIQQNRLIETIDSITKDIIEPFEQISEKNHIFLHKDTSNIPPKSRTDSVPLKEIVEAEILFNLTTSYAEMISLLKERLEKIFRTISEIDQVIEFNFEAAVTLLEQKKPELRFEEARKIITDGFARTVNLVNELIKDTSDIADESTDKLKVQILKFEREIQSLSDNERVYSLKVRLTRAKTRQKISEVSKNTLLHIRNFLPIAYALVKRIWNQYIRFRKIAGLEKESIVIEEKLADYLSESKKQIGRLPYVYQRLFRFEPLVDERFFGGRDNEIGLLQNEYRDWNSGKSAFTALVGERGSGRTTLINFVHKKVFAGIKPVLIDFERTFHDENTLLSTFKKTFQIKNADNLEQMVSELKEKHSKKVCIVENLQNTFLRVVGGFNVIEKFLGVMTQTQDQIFWLVTCTLYSWRYLDKVIQISRYFQKVVYLGALTPEQIESVILKRHRVSGFLLEFSYFDELQKNRVFRKKKTNEARQEYLKNLFFNMLNELSQGNITVAMLYWLRSIQQFSKDRVILKTELKFDFNFLQQLPDDDLFTLAAVFIHETLDASDHALIFRLTVDVSFLQLNRLQRSGLLEESVYGFRINPLLYRPLERTLKAKNILH